MRLLVLTCLTFTAVFATASTSAVDDILGAISMTIDKGSSLKQEFDALDSGTSVISLLNLYGELNNMMSDIKQVKDDLKNTPGPVSPEDCTAILDALYQVQPLVEGSLKTFTDKKPIIDNLPGFGRARALVALGLHDLKHLNDEIREALLALAPEHCMTEARILGDQFNAAYDACFAVYA